MKCIAISDTATKDLDIALSSYHSSDILPLRHFLTSIQTFDDVSLYEYLHFPDVFAIPKLIRPLRKPRRSSPHLWRARLLHVFPRANFNRHRFEERVITRARIRFGEGICFRANESLNLRLYARFRIGQINCLYDTLRPFLHVVSYSSYNESRLSILCRESRSIRSLLLTGTFANEKYRLKIERKRLTSSKVHLVI